ncbi:MAG: aspartate/glutamate racemase family protein [Alphaproteobacteria bacterium]|nr:aspartate/glutamate racemase family protein [Alphaproteobacteria bacterium]
MKTIGLIGGMTWEATEIYYRLINRAVQQHLGGLHSADIVMRSLDFAEPEMLARTGQWNALAALFIKTARELQSAGAGVLLLCANTAHRVAEQVEAAISIPLIHICDATAARIAADGLERVCLIGTAYTMREDFFKDRVKARGIDVFVPDDADRAEIHRVIFEEIVLGRLEEKSRQAYREIIARQVAGGAQGVILGCTEIPLLIGPADSPVPLYDTTQLHALAAVERALP